MGHDHYDLTGLIDSTALGRHLKVNQVTLWSLRKAGLPHIKVGRLCRYDLAEVLEWLRDRTQGAGYEGFGGRGRLDKASS